MVQHFHGAAFVDWHVKLTGLLVCLLMWHQGASFARADKFDAQLKAAVSDFQSVKREASKMVVQKYQRAKRKVGRNRQLDSQTRVALMAAMDGVIQEYVQLGRFSPAPELMEIEFAYHKKLAKGFEPIAKAFDAEIKDAMQRQNLSRSQTLLKQKAKMETELLGIMPLEAGMVLKGTLLRSDQSSVPYHLTITGVREGGLFEGVIDDNPGVAGNWRYSVRGVARGHQLSFEMTENLRGGISGFRATGFMSGDRLLAEVQEKMHKGRPKPAALVLNR